MLKKIDHIGIAVESLDESIEIFKKMGLTFEGLEEVEEQKVKTAFFNVGGVHVELLTPTSPESPIAKFIEKKGQGIHHIAYESDNIAGEIENLKNNGFQMIDNEPEMALMTVKLLLSILNHQGKF